MTPEEYVELAKLTDVPDYNAFRERLIALAPELLHAMLGIASESGEFVDAFKKHLVYGKELDVVNLEEECGDFFWYVAIFCFFTKTPISTIMERNIAKLRARYPNKFTEHDALNRNLERERAILEGRDSDNR